MYANYIVSGLEALTGVSLHALADFCPHLELMRLEGFQGLTTEALLALSQISVSWI
jgi:hypothetical protein